MGAEGLTRTHAQKATSGGALSQQPWPQHGSAGRRPTITEATLACWLWTPPDSVPSLAPSLSGRATWQDDRASWSPAPGTGNALHTSAPGSLKEPVPHLVQEQREAGAAVPISQTGNKRQEQAADNFSSSWKPVSCLAVLGGSVTPKFRSCQCPPGLSGEWCSHFPYQTFPACPERGGGPGR